MIRSPSDLPVRAAEGPGYADAVFLPEPAAAPAGGITVPQILHMVLANIWLSLGAFVVFAGVSFGIVKVLPKSYEATASLIVNTDTSDPLAGRVQPQYLSYTFFPTQVELINNSVVLQPVVDRLGLREDRRFNDGFQGDPKSLNDIVLAKLRAAIHVQQGNGSDLLYVSAAAQDPAQAAGIANAVAEEYLRHKGERTNAPAVERAKRYAQQLEELKEKVTIAQAKVAEYRSKFGMSDLKEGQGGDDLEGAALVDLTAKLQKAQTERLELEGQQTTPASAALRDRVDMLEAQLGQVSATLGPRHPRVLSLQSEIEATRKALSGNTAEQLARARDLENRYRAAVAVERSRLLQRRGLQDDGAKLLLEMQQAQETYVQALKGYDQVQFASVGNYKDVSLVSRAEPPLKPNKPNKMKLFAAALAASLALALGGPFAYEFFLNRRVRCRDDLERHFGIPLLGEFGQTSPA